MGLRLTLVAQGFLHFVLEVRSTEELILTVKKSPFHTPFAPIAESGISTPHKHYQNSSSPMPSGRSTGYRASLQTSDRRRKVGIVPPSPLIKESKPVRVKRVNRGGMFVVLWLDVCNCGGVVTDDEFGTRKED